MPVAGELRPGRALEIRNDDPLEQLRDLVATLALPPPVELFKRCMLCNAELSEPLAPDRAIELLLPGLRDIRGPVRQCPACGRVYWHGSHARRMRLALDRTLPGWLTQAD